MQQAGGQAWTALGARGIDGESLATNIPHAQRLGGSFERQEYLRGPNQNSTWQRTEGTHTGPRSRLYPGLSMCESPSAKYSPRHVCAL
jgi:hypothetical protein